MFSKFFEKNKSNGQLADYFKKKRKDNPQPNVSCVNIARHLASTSNSPAPSKQTKHERQNSPGQLVKQTQSNSGRPSTTKTSVKKIKRIERPEAPSKDKLKDLEKSKLGPSSKSPKLARPAFQDFFSSKGLKGISQLAANLKKNREMKPRTVKETQKTLDDSMKMRSSSKKLQKSQTTSSMSTRLPKAFTPLSNVSKKVSRESSQKQKRFSEGGNIVVKKTVSDVSKLLEKEKVRHNNNSLFLSAAKRNEAEKCLQLISGATLNQQGADINCQDREGWTAIHHACWNENLKLVNILLYNDAKLDLPDSGGVRPISLAVSRGNAMITRVLVKAGANVNVKDNGGNTPLHYASAKKDKSCMDLLLECGGKLDVKNFAGQTPLDVTSKSFAALFELQRVVQTKQKEMSIDNSSQPKGGVKKGSPEAAEFTSTHLESANTINKSLFSSKTRIVKPKDFKVHCLLGNGSFGDVFLVEKRDTKVLFAMKVLLKDNIFKNNLERYALTEKSVLSSINHPFIVRLHYSFQNADRLFMILDFCPGGDLGMCLQEEGHFTEDRAKIYLAEIVLALEELHSKDVIYRDLKPDNILLDQEGHVMLTDFGLSKQDVSEYFTGAKSFCGSVAYLAPEMLKRAGHGKAVDWYLLGVVMYEMLTGLPPYYAESKEELFKNIEHAQLQIPSNLSGEARHLLKHLLDRDPSSRLGAGPEGSKEIKKHPFFKDISWKAVAKRELRPPKPKFNLSVSKKNIPKDLLSEEEDGKNHILGWSFVGDSD